MKELPTTKQTDNSEVDDLKGSLRVVSQELSEVLATLGQIVGAVRENKPDVLEAGLTHAHRIFKCYDETGTSPSVWHHPEGRTHIDAMWARRDSDFRKLRGPDAFPIHGVFTCGACSFTWHGSRAYDDTQVECPRCKIANLVR